MDVLLNSLLFIALIAIFWELTSNNIHKVLTHKHSKKRATLYSIIVLACVTVFCGIITIINNLLIVTSFPEIQSVSILITNIIVIISIVIGIYITARILYKERRTTIIFVASFFSLVGIVICDLTLNYVNFVIPPELYRTPIYYLLLAAVILVIGGIIRIVVNKWIAHPIKELIEKVSGNLNEFVWVSIIGVCTYIPMIIYFNTVDTNDAYGIQIISRIVFLILYITIYLMIIFGVRRSMKILMIDDELSLAKKIQEQILPSQNSLNEIPGVKIAAVMNPYSEIGGDFYDAFKIDEEKSAFIIADVAGKGIPAALFMTQVKSYLKVYLRLEKSADYVMTSSNIDLVKKKEMTSMYYGAVISIFETKTRRFTYSCGGLFPPILIRKGSVSELEYSGDQDIGISDKLYSQFETILEKDDIIFLYTDGVVDTLSKDGKYYGKERLIDVISKETEPDKIISAVTEDIVRFSENKEPEDDVTILTFKVL